MCVCVCVCVGGKKGGMEDEEVERWVWREGGRRLVCEREGRGRRSEENGF